MPLFIETHDEPAPGGVTLPPAEGEIRVLRCWADDGEGRSALLVDAPGETALVEYLQRHEIPVRELTEVHAPARRWLEAGSIFG